MLFNSLSYAIFLPIVFALYWLLPHRHRWWLLLAASYYFYMSWNVRYVALILFTTVISYASAILLEWTDAPRQKRLILTAALVSCFGVLFVFKYFNFVSQSISDLCRAVSIPMHPVTLKLMLPVGISFYTFQTLSYVIDVYRGEIRAERHFGVYATFVSFFPQLVAGPIERSKNLLHQIREEHVFDYDQAAYGMKLMTWGFFKKLVVADNLAVYVDRIYNQIHLYQGLSLMVATVFFAFQIYCDFSGYSDIAKGTANLFGVKLMTNFKSPYFSTSIKEFWSRWHISLSTWFRDYVYIPLGGNRVKKSRHYFNLVATFLVSGLWHGANWTFVIWGGIHGVLQVGEQALGLVKKKPEAGERHGLKWWLNVIGVFIIVCLAWVFFRANTLDDAFYLLTHMFYGIGDPYLYAVQACVDMNIWIGRAAVLALYLVILMAYDYASLGRDVIAWVGSRRAAVRYLVYFGLVTFIIFNRSITESAFIYFQF